MVSTTFTWAGPNSELDSSHPFSEVPWGDTGAASRRDRVVELVKGTGLELIAEQDIPVAWRLGEREWSVWMATALVFKNIC